MREEGKRMERQYSLLSNLVFVLRQMKRFARRSFRMIWLSIPLKVGTPLQLSSEQGQMDVVISEVTDTEVTLDANHPLAGKELTFEIEIVSVA